MGDKSISQKDLNQESSSWVVVEGYLSGTHLGTHCGGVLTIITIESVNKMCNKLVINLTVPNFQ